MLLCYAINKSGNVVGNEVRYDDSDGNLFPCMYNVQHIDKLPDKAQNFPCMYNVQHVDKLPDKAQQITWSRKCDNAWQIVSEHMTTHVWQHIYDNTCMTTHVWQHMYDNTCMTTHVWQHMYDNTCMTTHVWQHMITHVWQHMYDNTCMTTNVSLIESTKQHLSQTNGHIARKI